MSEVEAARRARIAAARPELHRYCARLTGSTFDGEDVVQDVIERALVSLDPTLPDAMVRPWLFKVAHNRAIDFLRASAMRAGEPPEDLADIVDDDAIDPEDAVAHRQAMRMAIDRFVELPASQRSAVILKDVLGHTLAEIATTLDLSLVAVKAALHRGRARLAASRSGPRQAMLPVTASRDAMRFVELFNARDWDALRALLAHDVRLDQTARAVRRGVADVGVFFTSYAALHDWRLVPALLEGREIVAVLPRDGPASPLYFMRLAWRDGRLVHIRDFRHARYVVDGADVVLLSIDA